MRFGMGEWCKELCVYSVEGEIDSFRETREVGDTVMDEGQLGF
jgi:hypothetical protein